MSEHPHPTRRLGDLALSPLGLGTYLGAADDETDRLYEDAALRCLRAGVNVLDTAINYRCQRSERALGRAIARAAAEGVAARDEIVVASKAGFLPFDGARPADPGAYIRATYVDTGLLAPGDIAAGCHAIAPDYLADQLDRSRANLDAGRIDVYYLHNPETQLEDVDRETFLARVRAAFAVLERARAEGLIGVYGAATWSGFRVPPEHRGHLSLAELLACAAEAGGPDHGFRAVQLPFNPHMREAADAPTQLWDGTRVSLLTAAADAGVYVMSSASLAQGKCDPREALAAARSTPGLGTALVGMKTPAHVAANLAAAGLG